MFWKNKKKNSEKIICLTCGKIYKELSAICYLSPYYYDILNDEDKKEIAELSEDFCIIKHFEQTDRFIRTILAIPINDYCETLDYGIWVSVSEKSFDDYYKNFENETNEPVYFGRICNEILDYEETTLGLQVNVQVRNGGIRPEILLHESEHKLITDWENGISLKEAEVRLENALKLETKNNN